MRSPTFACGRIASCSSSSAAGSSLPSTYARRKPANSMALPLAVSTALSPFGPFAVISIVVRVEHALELTRRQAEVGRPDRFVSLLSVLHPRLVATRTGVILTPEHLTD